MTTAVLSETVSRVAAKAEGFDLPRVFLILLAAPLFVAGFVAWWLWRVVTTVLGWLWAAAVVGWQVAAERHAVLVARRSGGG